MSREFDIVADPSARLKSSVDDRTSIQSDLKRAAVAIGRLASPAYEKLSRFQAKGTKTIEFGRSPGRLTPAERLGGHFKVMTKSITDGVREAILKTQRDVAAAKSAASVSMLSAKSAIYSAKAKTAAINSFVETATANVAGAKMAQLTTMKITDMAARLKGFAASLSTGIIRAVTMGTASVRDNGAKISRFLGDGVTTMYIGATEAMRRVAANRHARLAGYAVAIGGLGLFGLHTAGAELVTKGLGLMGNHMNMPELADIGATLGGKIVAASDVATNILSGGSMHQMAASPAVMEAANHITHHLGNISTAYWHNAGQIAGHSPAGHDLIRAASFEHLYSTTSTMHGLGAPDVALKKLMDSPLGMANAHAAMFGHHGEPVHHLAQHAGHHTAGAHHPSGGHHRATHHGAAPFNDPPGAADELMKQELAFLHAGGHPNPTDGSASWLDIAKIEHAHRFNTVAQATSRTATSLSAALPPLPHVGNEDISNLCRTGQYSGMVMPKCA